MLSNYQLSNIGLKYGPLIATLLDSVKCFLRILKSVQISNGIHNSIVIRNGKIIYKVLWVEYYFRLNFNF